jgi:dipeptidyl aminopeptidase/acylaminoacyl peptidase
MIIDLQRAVDVLLERPDVDPNRLAFVGRSYGGVMGVQLASVERRLKTYILSVCDGGQIIHFAGEGHNGEAFRSRSETEQKRWLAAMAPIEPIHYIHRAAPAKLLFQFGQQDQSVRVENARLLYQAAPQPKSVKWYRADHELNAQAYVDWLHWLHNTVGTSPAGPNDQQGPKGLTFKSL